MFAFESLPTRVEVRFYDSRGNEIAPLNEDGTDFVHPQYCPTIDDAETIAISRFFTRLFLVSTRRLKVRTVATVTARDSFTGMLTEFKLESTGEIVNLVRQTVYGNGALANV